MVKIEDMAVSLILEEWGCQNLARRNLSRDNKQENYGNMFSQGKTDSGLLSKIVLPLFFVSCGNLWCIQLNVDKDLETTEPLSSDQTENENICVHLIPKAQYCDSLIQGGFFTLGSFCCFKSEILSYSESSPLPPLCYLGGVPLHSHRLQFRCCFWGS